MLTVFLSILLLFDPGSTDIKDQVKTYLNDQFKQYERFEYEILKMPTDYSSIEILKEKDFKINENLSYLPVKIVKNGRTVQAYITIRLKLYKNVLVALRDIDRKENLSQSDFELRLCDVTELNASPINTKDDLNNYRSKKNLKDGEVLTENDIEKLPVINSGDKITASIVNGNVLIQTDAVSRQDGSIGDVINILTDDNRQFKAKVVDFNNVLIVE